MALAKERVKQRQQKTLPSAFFKFCNDANNKIVANAFIIPRIRDLVVASTNHELPYFLDPIGCEKHLHGSMGIAVVVVVYKTIYAEYFKLVGGHNIYYIKVTTAFAV